MADDQRHTDGSDISDQGNRSYSFGRFRLDCRGNERTLFEDDNPKSPQPSASLAGILEKLLERPNEFVSTPELLKATASRDESTIAVAVHHLRQMLPGVVIENQKKVGYRYVKEVDPTPEGNGQNGSSAKPDNLTGNEFLVIAGVVSLVIFLLPLAFLRKGSWDPESNKILSFIQALAVLVAILYDQVQRLHIKKSVRLENKEQKAVRQFRFWWTCLLSSWLALYFTWFLSNDQLGDQRGPIIATLLNNANSLTLALCYIVLDRPTVVSNNDQSVKPTAVSGTDQSAKPVPFMLGSILVLGFSVIEGLLIVVLNRSGHNGSTRYVLLVADLLSGFVGAVAMALCISRLHSRLMGPSTRLTIIPVVLYFYVVIQPFYILVNETFLEFERIKQFKTELGIFKTIIMQLAFFLKALMFIYVMELVRSRRLLFYMINARDIYEEVDRRWEKF